MHSLSRYSLLLLLAAVFIAAPAPAAEPPTRPPGVDLAKTRDLFRSWTLRKSFPDSITLAYYHAYSLKTLDGGVAPELKDRLVAFIRKCRRDDGGFVSNPKYGAKTRVVFTYYALAALRLLGADDAIDREGTTAFVQGLIARNGGFRPSAGDKAAPTLASTFFGVESLRLLHRLERLDRERTGAFVLGHRTGDGGFGITTRGANNPRAVSMAVRTLATLGRLGEEVRQEAVSYLQNAIALVGMKGPKFRALSSMQSAADMVAALDRLGALPEVITDRLLEFVVARYIPQNGGFGPAPGLGTTPPSTYQGLYCLVTLGELEQAETPIKQATANKTPGGTAD